LKKLLIADEPLRAILRRSIIVSRTRESIELRLARKQGSLIFSRHRVRRERRVKAS